MAAARLDAAIEDNDVDLADSLAVIFVGISSVYSYLVA
jgi:hypothetical protein